MSVPSGEQARSAISRFAAAGRLVSLEPYTAGHINHAWQACLESEGGTRRYLLQQINRHVFHRPEHVLVNMQRVTSHIRGGLAREGVADAERRVPSLCPTHDGAAWHKDERGETWRLLPWIEGTRSAERAATAADARATARAFGLLPAAPDGPARRHRSTRRFPSFHDTEARVRALERVTRGRPRGARRRVPGRDRGAARPPPARRGARVTRRGRCIAERPVHNDAKIANVLFDDASGEALAVIDLDTTMPGLAAHDFGDLVRSSVSDSAEDERDLARVAVRLEVFAALATGFLEGTGGALSAGERAQLVTGARVIVYEQAVRFLADHLDGDRYYRIARPSHNLDRARAQLQLLASLESASPELERIVAQAAG